MDPELRFEIERLRGSIRQSVRPETLTESDLEDADGLVVRKGASLTEAVRERLAAWLGNGSGLLVKSGTSRTRMLWSALAGILETVLRDRRPQVRLVMAHSTTIRAGAFVLDPGNHTATIAGEEIALRPMEYLLLAHFLEYPHRLHHRQELVDVLWGSGAAIDPRTVDVHVARLRKALSEKGRADAIETVFRFGYRFRPDRGRPEQKLSEP
ncbi:protein containing Signal transduction response regulator [mine drainage metagenome]|uniref:Protein containing Signal transduction response regulator n=1 Tax=mine drainage metagenome TaxID=410659 RepID=T1B1C4_9ZZZZ